MKRQNQKGMILAIDMGNTNIVIGCVDDEKIYFEERLCTDYSKTELEYAIGFKTVLELYNIESEQIHGAIISSVVPQLVNVIKSAVEKIIGITPLIVGPGVKTGLNLLMDQPKQVGTDMVVDAVAAIHEYGAPVLIIDVGTATTISAVDDKKNRFSFICPRTVLTRLHVYGDSSGYPRIGGFTGIPDGTASTNQSGSSKIRDWKEYDCVYAERCGLRECKLYRRHG